MREYIADKSVDLVYLDPPFNSARDYNILFSAPGGGKSEAQITAFEDSWHWGQQAEKEFGEILNSGRTHVAEMIQALRNFLGESTIMAYLVMMANRLIELRRVLKDTGSLYLHCDPTASHYLKIVLDSIYGAQNFRSEIIWKRTSSHSSARRWGPIHDTILFYANSPTFTWNKIYGTYDESYIKKYYRHIDNDGRNFRLSDLTGSGTRNGESGKEWGGFNPTSFDRHWAIPTEVKEQFRDVAEEQLTPHQWLDLFDKHGLVSLKAEGRDWPHVKRYLDRMQGIAQQDIVLDIPPLSSRDAERLGYPTQKPLALLERIISASSNKGDIVLDPFCGCGTAVHAAQNLGRKWIGIDITHLAVSLIEKRLKDAFPGVQFSTYGTPKDIEGARELSKRDKYQFQWWACSLVDAQPYRDKKKGADGGIDGIIYFQDEHRGHKKIIVSVKGGEHVNVGMIRELAHVVHSEKAEIGLFVTLARPTSPMVVEAAGAGFYQSPLTKKQYPRIQILTVKELLDGKKPQYVDFSEGRATYKRAKREDRKKVELKLKV
ncbi:MAG: restriction endonuclease [Desulfovibrio sp.]|nr:restriction endonuclease [Desulfovibrio sp.]